MQYGAKRLKERLDRENIGYEYKGAPKGADVFMVLNQGEYMQQQIFAFVSENDVSVIIRLGAVPLYSREDLLCEINEIHKEYRWISVYITEENWLQMKCDAMFTNSSAGDICMHALIRVASIADDCYNRLIKHI